MLSLKPNGLASDCPPREGDSASGGVAASAGGHLRRTFEAKPFILRRVVVELSSPALAVPNLAEELSLQLDRCRRLHPDR